MYKSKIKTNYLIWDFNEMLIPLKTNFISFIVNMKELINRFIINSQNTININKKHYTSYNAK